MTDGYLDKEADTSGIPPFLTIVLVKGSTSCGIKVASKFTAINSKLADNPAKTVNFTAVFD